MELCGLFSGASDLAMTSVFFLIIDSYSRNQKKRFNDLKRKKNLKRKMGKFSAVYLALTANLFFNTNSTQK